MAEYIERKAVLKEAESRIMWDASAAAVYELIRDAPAADVAPVRHGWWIDAYPDIEPNPMFMYGICSECGFEQGISKYLNYCPNCGVKMDGGDGNIAMA